MTLPNPAFPHTMPWTQSATDPCFFNGLTKREYFAAAALTGMLPSLPTIAGGRKNEVAAAAVAIADALIAELARESD